MPVATPVAPATTLAGRITRAREAAGLSREQLATAIGRSHATVVSYELDRQDPLLRTLRAIARALGTTSADLLAGTDGEVGTEDAA